MSDPLDREISQAIKASTDRSLAGWTFTPAMRKAVLDRVAEEPAPPAAPVPQRRPNRNYIRPLSWVAAAAAVLVVSFNILPKMLNQSSGDPKTTALKMGAPAPQGALESTSEPPADADRSAPRSVGATKAAAVSEDTAGNAVTGSDEPIAAMTAAQVPATEPAATDPASTDPASADPVSTDPEVTITALGEVGGTEPGETPEPSGPREKGIEPGARGSLITLMAPAVAMAEGAGENTVVEPEFTIMAAPANIAVSSLPQGDVVVLTATSVKVFNQAGALVTEDALTEYPGPMATAPDGRTAVADGTLLQFYTNQGQPDGSLKLDLPPAAVALGPDSRVAVADEHGANLYEGNRFAMRLDGVKAASLAFANDGTLALLTQAEVERTLRLYAADGTAVATQPVTGEGEGLAFTADGQQVVAGSQVFDRSGRLLWEVPFPPARVSAFGSGDALLAWNHQVVSLFHAQDGATIWSAEYPEGAIQQAAGSAAGDQVAVVGDSAAGTTVWVLRQDGTQRYAERLASAPVGLAIEGDSLILLTSQGLDVRTLEP